MDVLLALFALNGLEVFGERDPRSIGHGLNLPGLRWSWKNGFHSGDDAHGQLKRMEEQLQALEDDPRFAGNSQLQNKGTLKSSSEQRQSAMSSEGTKDKHDLSALLASGLTQLNIRVHGGQEATLLHGNFSHRVAQPTDDFAKAKAKLKEEYDGVDEIGRGVIQTRMNAKRTSQNLDHVRSSLQHFGLVADDVDKKVHDLDRSTQETIRSADIDSVDSFQALDRDGVSGSDRNGHKWDPDAGKWKIFEGIVAKANP